MPVEIWVFWVFSFSPAWFGSCTSDPGTEVNCVELVWSVLWIDTDFDWKIQFFASLADLKLTYLAIKLALLMYRAHADHLLSYLSYIVTLSNCFVGCPSLRSACTVLCIVPGTVRLFGRCSFIAACPSILNVLPLHVCHPLIETALCSKLRT